MSCIFLSLHSSLARSLDSDWLIGSHCCTVRSKWSSARGNLISSGQDAFKAGLLDWSPRLLLAMYSCDIQATGPLLLLLACYAFPLLLDILMLLLAFGVGEVLGKVYGVVAKRRGRIVSEEMKEGTAFFTITSLLPVVESFGFADGMLLNTLRFLQRPRRFREADI